MKITILTLFPELFKPFLSTSIIKIAIEKKLVEIKVINFREYSNDKHKKVDDYSYGGGAGMVLKLQPIVDCLHKIAIDKSMVYLMSPSGKKWDQKTANVVSKFADIVLICGHYEGFDERLNEYVNDSYSIGDYILTGGELPAMVITESITRLIEGVIDKESLDVESFDNNLLDFPVYTRPEVFDGKCVPNILLSGDQKKIKEWREKQREFKTKKNRPDLLKNKKKWDILKKKC